jgi:hypothetical protein
MFQPLLCESAPACRNVAASSRALASLLANLFAKCHEPARQEKKYGRGDATHTNQFRSNMIILWKSFDLSSNDTAFVTKHRSRAES